MNSITIEFINENSLNVVYIYIYIYIYIYLFVCVNDVKHSNGWKFVTMERDVEFNDIFSCLIFHNIVRRWGMQFF